MTQLKYLKKIFQPKILCLTKLFFKNARGMKTFPEEQKLRLITTKSALNKYKRKFFILKDIQRWKHRKYKTD
jgi:hypothetical protein